MLEDSCGDGIPDLFGMLSQYSRWEQELNSKGTKQRFGQLDCHSLIFDKCPFILAHRLQTGMASGANQKKKLILQEAINRSYVKIPIYAF